MLCGDHQSWTWLGLVGMKLEVKLVPLHLQSTGSWFPGHYSPAHGLLGRTPKGCDGIAFLGGLRTETGRLGAQ